MLIHLITKFWEIYFLIYRKQFLCSFKSFSIFGGFGNFLQTDALASRRLQHQLSELIVNNLIHTLSIIKFFHKFSTHYPYINSSIIDFPHINFVLCKYCKSSFHLLLLLLNSKYWNQSSGGVRKKGVLKKFAKPQ